MIRVCIGGSPATKHPEKVLGEKAPLEDKRKTHGICGTCIKESKRHTFVVLTTLLQTGHVHCQTLTRDETAIALLVFRRMPAFVSYTVKESYKRPTPRWV